MVTTVHICYLCVKNFLIILNNIATDAFKIVSKRAIQKTAEATDDSIGNKILTKLRKFQKTHNKRIQKQLQMSMIKKYLKKDIHLLKNGKKLLMS